MNIFDAHNDTLLKLVESPEHYDLATLTNSHVDLEKMNQGQLSVQIFAVFTPRRYLHGMALHKALQMIDHFWQNMERYPKELFPILWREEFTKVGSNQGIGSILSLEGGEPLQGEIGNLRNFFRLGVRALSLTWNNRNDLADGVGEDSANSGLSDFGRQVIEEMNRLGMIVDVSHLSEKGFWEVIKLSKTPIIASHSNAASLCPHPRNLTDQQIKAIADQGGVIGVNFYPRFLTNDIHATLDDVIEQIIYLLKVGGSESVGLGSDFDGISDVPSGLEDVSTLPKIALALKKRGISSPTIEKVMGENFLTLASQIFPSKSS